MKIKKIRLENFRAYKDVTIELDKFNCIVGQNDVGKSTIVKALELLLNHDANVTINDYNGKNNNIGLHIFFRCPIAITAIVETTNPELFPFANNGLITIRKEFEMNSFKEDYKYEYYIIVNNTFFNFDNNSQHNKYLLSFSRRSHSKNIERNGYIFIPLSEILTMELNDILPVFKVFSPSMPLKEIRDYYIHHFFSKEIRALIRKIKNYDIEKDNALNFGLSSISFSNDDMTTWIKDDKIVPLSNRGEGIQVNTKLKLFQQIAELNNNDNVLFAFEEPETHLHPSAQIAMYDAIREVSNNPNYQVIITTHSPTIVSQCAQNEIIQVVKDDTGLVSVKQHSDDIVTDVIKDLGITPNSKIISELGFKKCYVFVEGKYDVDFFKHIFKLRGINDEHIGFIPMGSGDNVGLWVNKKLVDALNKPYIFIIDSDNKNKTDKYNIEPNRIHILHKREIENYLKPESLEQLSILSSNPNCLQKYKQSWDKLDIPLVLFVGKNNINMQSKIEFNTEDVKNCANQDAAFLTNLKNKTHLSSVTTDGVKKRADKQKEIINKHFFEDGNATLADLDFEYKDENGNTKDEFLDIYTKIKNICGDI